MTGSKACSLILIMSHCQTPAAILANIELDRHFAYFRLSRMEQIFSRSGMLMLSRQSKFGQIFVKISSTWLVARLI